MKRVLVPIEGAARWGGNGFWAGRVRTCCESTIPAMGRLMIDEDRPRYVGNFEVAAELTEGRHRGPKWNDGDFYKWLEAASASVALTGNDSLAAQLDALIDLIGRTQDPDGYIHTDVQIAQRAGAATPRFGNPMDFEMYNMGHLISAAVVHHRATGKDSLLQIALRAARFLDQRFAHPIPRDARHGICPSHLMALIDLSRVTGDRRHVQLAARLLDMRDLVTGGDDDNQDRIPLRQQRTAHGHAVRATYLYAGAADVYAETGDESLRPALESIWRDLVGTKLYVTGGCGALFDGASPDGAIDQTAITRVHQAFGRAFQLPHSTSHNETCAAIGNLFFNWRMLQVTGEAKYADVVEWTMYNSVLAGVSLAGTEFFYTNTLRQLEPMPCELRWSRHRQARINCFCCPPNVARVVAQSADYAYLRGDDAVVVVLYGTNALETTLPAAGRVRLRQETGYPWAGTVRLTVEACEGELALRLRIPGWCDGASVRVNDGPPAAARPETFFELRRRWSPGDVVELDLPMRARWIEAHPLVEEARNQVALARGPLVYCLESADLPPGVRLLEVAVRADAELAPLPPDPTLAGAMPLQCEGVVRDGGDWGDRLYRPRAGGGTTSLPLKLIPYFAWDNRGAAEMSVWLPIACG